MSGIRFDLLRANGETENLAAFAVDGLPFIDLVFQLRYRMWLEVGDELRLSFDIPVISRISGTGLIDTEMFRYTEDWQYSTGGLTGCMAVTHFRFTKIGESAWIELLDEIPAGLYVPDATKAEKIR